MSVVLYASIIFIAANLYRSKGHISYCFTGLQCAGEEHPDNVEVGCEGVLPESSTLYFWTKIVSLILTYIIEI